MRSSNQPSASVQASQRAQGAAVDQPAPVAEIARGGRNHLTREDHHEQQRNQRIDQVLQHGKHPLRFALQSIG
jgi:hypothetical protein